MATVIVTGSCGLIGNEACRFFHEKGFTVVGIDNGGRKDYFGPQASTAEVKKELLELERYHHLDFDITDKGVMNEVFYLYGPITTCIIHTAAQPSHDWAATDPFTDFNVNAFGTLNLLECAKKHCPSAVFIHMSTNKVYGDRPNDLPIKLEGDRYTVIDSMLTQYIFLNGIDERMPIDQSKHSLFGCSKAYADLIVQEYGKYFGMKTVCFRGGCLTGGMHSGVKAHGFLSYLVKCVLTGEKYSVNGYMGHQVRDNIHSYDVVSAMWEFYNNPKEGEVYNIGGGYGNSCSIIEAIKLIEQMSGKKANYELTDFVREGDHIWWVTDMGKFKKDYPNWKMEYDLKDIIEEIILLNS